MAFFPRSLPAITQQFHFGHGSPLHHGEPSLRMCSSPRASGDKTGRVHDRAGVTKQSSSKSQHRLETVILRSMQARSKAPPEDPSHPRPHQFPCPISRLGDPCCRRRPDTCPTQIHKLKKLSSNCESTEPKP